MSADDRTPSESIDELVDAARQFEPTQQDVDSLIAGLDLGGPSGGGGISEPAAGAATGGHGGAFAAAAAGIVGIVAVVGAILLSTSTATVPPAIVPSAAVASIDRSDSAPSASWAPPPITSGELIAAPFANTVPSSSASAVIGRPKSSGVLAPPAQDANVESEMLHRARASMRREPAQALAILKGHRARFPHGILAEERDALQVEALARLGKSEEAARENERFREAHPDSVHGERIDSVLSQDSDAGAK